MEPTSGTESGQPRGKTPQKCFGFPPSSHFPHPATRATSPGKRGPSCPAPGSKTCRRNPGTNDRPYTRSSVDSGSPPIQTASCTGTYDEHSSSGSDPDCIPPTKAPPSTKCFVATPTPISARRATSGFSSHAIGFASRTDKGRKTQVRGRFLLPRAFTPTVTTLPGVRHPNPTGQPRHTGWQTDPYNSCRTDRNLPSSSVGGVPPGTRASPARLSGHPPTGSRVYL